MRNFKLFFSLSITAVTLLGSVAGTSAAKGIDDSTEVSKSAESATNNNFTNYGGIDLEKSQFDKIFESNGPVYLGDGLWAEELSYNELVQEIAKNRNISTTDAKNTLSTNRAAENVYFVHFYEQFEVGTTGWYPQLDIYVKCQGIYRDFVGIEDLNLIRSYNYNSKEFNGKLQAKVESNKKIYWVINGDFYNNGSTAITFGGAVGVDKYAELNFSVTSSNNHFGYVYKTGDIKNR